jgi:hypothetical protein
METEEGGRTGHCLGRTSDANRRPDRSRVSIVVAYIIVISEIVKSDLGCNISIPEN